jgi:glycosyltransferase involved in cell wall biosynthesis
VTSPNGESPMLGRRRLRVALYSGLMIRHDAISASLRTKLDVLEGWRDRGVPVDVVAYVQSTDRPRRSVVVAPTAAAALNHSDCLAADVHLFEFGIYYELFDLLMILPRSASRLAVYHNITPLGLVDDPVVRDAVVRSQRQKANLDVADQVVCVSEYNRDDLLDYGLPADRLSVLHLPGFSGVPSARPTRRHGPVELLFVGRFVRSKGVLDLLQAVDVLRASGQRNFCLTLAGNQSFSDSAIVSAVDDAVRDPSGTVRSVGEPNDRRLAELMARSDVLVMPSYHEGYCVPVIEAYAKGCQVTAYDAGNLPNVVGRLGQLVRTGDVTALAASLGAQISAIQSAPRAARVVPTLDGALPLVDWQQHVAEHLMDYSARAYEVSFARLLAGQAAAHDVDPEVVDQLLAVSR